MKYETYRVIRTLGTETRYKIMGVLMKHPKGIAVQDIAADLGMTHSAISHQLAVLEREQIVTDTKRGRENHYQIAKSQAGAVALKLMRI
ncbi:helix-turn-helix transcriptional regulator [Bradyrhizobium sp. ORS 285]|uniref:ArsR/SmtB family transcription factor n=1 Tax=Bradyrhizobium sp. ORS 285 TaxID=115808 RepID=UPI0006818743|nr:metalloregulator ArsR/SmtB family transcription factor [Bradyrhizobium sp. ORS 285]